MKQYLRQLLAPKAKKDGMKLDGFVFYGDSIGHAVSRVLQARNVDFHNLTQPGDTAENAWARFPYDVRSRKTVVIQLGANDIGKWEDPLPFIRKMHAYCLDEGREVVLTGLIARDAPFSTTTRVRNMYTELSRNCRHAYWGLVEKDLVDGLHPSAAMAEKLADRLLEALK